MRRLNLFRRLFMRVFRRTVIGTVATVPASGLVSGMGTLFDIGSTRSQHFYNQLARRSVVEQLYLDGVSVGKDFQSSIEHLSAAHPEELNEPIAEEEEVGEPV